MDKLRESIQNQLPKDIAFLERQVKDGQAANELLEKIRPPAQE